MEFFGEEIEIDAGLGGVDAEHVMEFFGEEVEVEAGLGVTCDPDYIHL